MQEQLAKAKELLIPRCAKHEVLHNKRRQDASVICMYLKVTCERLQDSSHKILLQKDNDCFGLDSLFEVTVNVAGEKNVNSMWKYEKLH